MGANNGGQEIEIKLQLASAESGRALLLAAGFAERHPRCLERNTLFDDPGGNLRSRGQLVRLRHYGGQVLLTYKTKGADRAGTVDGSRHKHRPELETTVADAAPLIAVLQAAGLAPVLRYEKYRTEFAKPGESGLALLDETPIGTYLELEGEPEWIDRTAGLLGFSVDQYITASYLSLNEQDCLKNGLPVTDMIFDEAETSEKASGNADNRERKI